MATSAPALRTSERSSFKRCQQKWWWGYVDGLKPLREKNPLWFGSGIHLALADWYQAGLKRGPHPAETWLGYCADEERMIPQDYEEDGLKYIAARELGESMMNGYVEHYGKDPDWDVICTERAFKYLVRDKTTRRLVARYLGTFDGVYRSRVTGEIWLMEHKTAAQIILTHLPLDDQAGSYLFVAEAVLKNAGLMKPTDHIVGIMYNFLKKSTADDRPRDEEGRARNKPTKAHYLAALDAAEIPDVRQNMKVVDLEKIAQRESIVVLGDISKNQASPLFIREPVWRSEGDKVSMHKRIVAEVAQMNAVRSGVFTPTKTPTRDCSWDCDFFRMCQLHESGDDWEEYRDNLYKKIDPYADHRSNRKSA